MGKLMTNIILLKNSQRKLEVPQKNTVLRCTETKYRKTAEGTIHKFVSNHIIFVSRNSAFERTWHLGYAEFKYMQYLI